MNHKSGGFTLVEMVVVIILVSILSVVAMPRFFKVSPFQEMGFTDELIAAYRYANKVAIASGCDTQVVTTLTSYQLKQRVNCQTGAFSQNVMIAGGNSSGYSGAPPSGLTLSASSLYFDPMGRPRNSSSDALLSTVTTVSVGSRSLSVEPETGFVH